jgi:hypothetical protein
MSSVETRDELKEIFSQFEIWLMLYVFTPLSVLPIDLRERIGFQPNQKIALVTFEQKQELCFMLLIKTEKLEEAVTRTLSQLF